MPKKKASVTPIHHTESDDMALAYLQAARQHHSQAKIAKDRADLRQENAEIDMISGCANV